MRASATRIATVESASMESAVNREYKSQIAGGRYGPAAKVGWLLALSVVGTGGCALAKVTVTPPTASVGTELSGGNLRSLQLVLPFEDERPTRSRCGMQKNGFNADTADVICSAEPAQWLAELLASELRAAGFTVVAAPTPQGVRIQGHLLQFFVEPKVGWFTFNPEADIHVRLVASSDSGLLAEREFYVKGVETSIVGRESNFQAATNDAVRSILKDMVAAVLALMNRYPELGIARRPPGS